MYARCIAEGAKIECMSSELGKSLSDHDNIKFESVGLKPKSDQKCINPRHHKFKISIFDPARKKKSVNPPKKITNVQKKLYTEATSDK